MAFSRRKWLCVAATAVLGFTHANMAGAAVGVGDKAPDFALSSTTGKPVRLADFAGKKSLVLFFYIGAFTNS